MNLKLWWYKHGWEVRIKIYTYLKMPIDFLRFILKLMQLALNLIDKSIVWLLWNLLDKLFNKKQ